MCVCVKVTWICSSSPWSTLIRLAGRKKEISSLHYWNIQLVYLVFYHFRKNRLFAWVKGRCANKGFTKQTHFRWYWPTSRMSLFPSFLFASKSISNAALMISWLFDEGAFCSPFWSSNSMKWRQYLISMWNIYSAFEFVYTERWKRLPNLGFKNKKKEKKAWWW